MLASVCRSSKSEADEAPANSAAAQASASFSAAAVDKATAKKARKLERRRLRKEIGINLHQQQQQVLLSDEERAKRKADKRLRRSLARAQVPPARRETAAGGMRSHVTPAVASSHPFHVTDERDHAETPFEA
jgi:hypothetical protein